MRFITKQEMFLLEQIVIKNFAARYKESSLGILWSLLRPLLYVIILTTIFSTIFSGQINNYPVYILSGRCIFEFFIATVGGLMNSIKVNQSIILQTAVPKYIFILGNLISEFFNFIISVMLLIVVMAVTNAPFYFNIMPLAIIPVISLIIMVTGIGFCLSIVRVYYSDVQHLWSVLIMAIMFSSAIFYPIEIVPQPYQYYLSLSPLYWIVTQFRAFIYQGIIPDLLAIVNSLLISTIIFVFGLIIFKKYEKKVTLKF